MICFFWIEAVSHWTSSDRTKGVVKRFHSSLRRDEIRAGGCCLFLTDFVFQVPHTTIQECIIEARFVVSCWRTTKTSHLDAFLRV